ncbi:MAG: hypothetical protein LBL46_01065 [Rickettsiales bacterium]|jgi:hypothetical protein|nr:hypothetical protein [Rickettsiales bacterium]
MKVEKIQMNKIFAVVLGAFLALGALPSLAEVAPVYYEEVAEEAALPETEEDAAVAPAAPKVQPNPAMPVVAPSAAAVSARAGSNIRRATANAAGARGNAAGSRAVSARTAVAPVVRAPGNAVAPIQAGRPVASRTAASRGNAAIQSRATGRTRSAANSVVRGNIAPVNAAAPANDRGVRARAASNGSLYNAARVGTTGSVMSAGTRSVGSSTGRAAQLPTLFNSNDTTKTTAPTSTNDAAAAEELAAKTEFCKAQYLNCMDGFCAVLDDNSGRCTCSENIKKYEKVEAALKQAAIDLQDIATKIRYLGLSTDDVNSLFTQTDAEKALGQTDSSALKTDLERIQKLLIDPTNAAQVAANSGSLSFNLDALNLGSDFSWSSFLTGESSSIQNQRGKVLYETAYGKCTQVLTDCASEGVKTDIIQTNYDIEIDKQCVAYERALVDENDTMKTTIRNANTVLQQARLMVAQNKNKYDIKGCVSAVDACMVDSFVCGDDYQNCLDKTGQYIIGGNIIVGSEPGDTTGAAGGLAANWKFGTSDYAFENGKTVMDMVASAFMANSADDNLATMLKARLGSIDSNGKVSGMCAGVMQQCQNFTYANDKYKEGNEVEKEYLIRTLQRIKGIQDEVMATYGESCRQDIISCFSKNGANSSSPSQPLTTAISACGTYIKTCSSVNEISEFSGDVAAYVCPATKPTLERKSTGTTIKWECVAPTCPAESTADATATIVGNGINGGKAVPVVGCRCTNAALLIDGSCAPACPADSYPDSTATRIGDGLGSNNAVPQLGCRCTSSTTLTSGNC